MVCSISSNRNITYLLKPNVWQNTPGRTRKAVNTCEKNQKRKPCWMNCRNTQTGTLNIRQTTALQSTWLEELKPAGWSQTVSHLCNVQWRQEGIILCGQRDQGVKLTIRFRALSKKWKRVVKKRNSSTNCYCCYKWNQHQRHTQFREHMH